MKTAPSDGQHCQPLFDTIVEQIRLQGKISFADYMNAALYHPQWGYYRNALTKFGEEGDFITAPELSPLFGECIAHWCKAEMAKLTHPSKSILEFGAGAGHLAATVLSHLATLDALPEAYYILEISAVLKSRQHAYLKKTVPDLVDRVVWLERLPASPLHGLVIANEVLDAMPVHKFQQATSLQEVFVTLEADKFVWVADDPLSPGLSSAVEALGIDFPSGYCSEINLALPGWIKSIDDCLAQGAALFIDYGFLRSVYYHPQRSQGTLMCHYQHRAHPDPFVHVGLQDITAHVDFTSLQEAAQACGFTITYYENQARFLIDWGLLDRVKAYQQAQAHDALALHKLSHQVRQLTFPTEMGELFKAITLEKLC